MGKFIPDANGGGNFAPTALMKEEGKMIRGVLESVRSAKTQYGPRPVYSIKVTDATCAFTQGDATVTPEGGTVVDMFAPTRLERQLVKVPFGTEVTITHVGMKKVGKGQPAHIYTVEAH